MPRTITAISTLFFASLALGAHSPPKFVGLQIHKGTNHRWGAPPVKAAVIAQSYLGAPYHWGGTSPRGFDCSGLVQYAYGKAGVQVPRTAETQHAAATPIDVDELRQGDLVFFRRRQGLHVGIYVGEGRFIHAPSPGKRVMYGSLENPYWQNQYKSGGRLLLAN